MCTLVLLLTISVQLVESCVASQQVPSTPFSSITFAALQKLCQRNFRKFHGSCKSRFGGSEKDCYFLKIPKWQHKLVWVYKRGKLISYFLDNAAKTCLYWLKVSENIKIEHVFQSKAFFNFSSNLPPHKFPQRLE